MTQTFRDSLVAQLRDSGALRTAPWEDAFAAVPREVFVRHCYRQDTDRQGIAVWRPCSTTEWINLVYSDQTLVTRLDPATADLTADGGWTGVATSSSTQPSIMAKMLEALDVQDGHRVLEIGTGTGYTTALLCARLGHDKVTSIDIDPETVTAARAALATLGMYPDLAVGDGRLGWPTERAFDRLIATCSISRLPDQWRRQVRQGGVILADLATGLEGGLIAWTIRADGGADGWFTAATGRFMPARASADSYPAAPRVSWAPQNGERHTKVSGGDVRRYYPFRLLLALLHPDLELAYWMGDDGVPHLQLQTTAGAWARAPLPEGEVVSWGGPDCLWDQVETAWEWWTQTDRPDHTAFGVTVSPTGEHRATWRISDRHGHIDKGHAT
ncbi:methyltransferase domain-containing protein [Actinocorallia sp. API 0066]|uniref:methyltransferase domain-containing protein n=1 Tax=Actinocorallia sp. API 0066 TaxID=2896846 RepID=UPI001E3AAAA7|nr:methyltransferase domain-containing protein [Actinocorallia sp. API 0066]MCD0452835.1 methyltransferase domain-containing protein [Actinocorallia sp. API 0066]